MVFLKFSEALVDAPKDQKYRHLSCWQRPAAKYVRARNNYPTFANQQEPATSMLVPLDRSSMSLCVQLNGPWESTDQE